MTEAPKHESPALPRDQFLRLPGLYRRWELDQVVEPGTDFHLEEAGKTSEGTPLFAVYRREHSNNQEEK